MSRLLISALPGEARLLRLDRHGGIEAARIVRADRPDWTGLAVAGRVTAVERSLEAAFLDLGSAIAGFLPLSTLPGKPKVGERLLCRIERPGTFEKGPRLSASQEGFSEAEREAFAAGDRLGPLASFDEVLAAVRELQAGVEEIRVDDIALSPRIDASAPVRLHTGPQSLFESEGQTEPFEDLVAGKVRLAGGGALRFEPGIALTAVDVDLGEATESGGREARRRLNAAALEALPGEIVRRGLSGLVVVDLLTQSRPADRKALGERAKAGLRAAGIKGQIWGPSPSGVLELTLERRRFALHELLWRPATSGLPGWEPDPLALAFSLLRRLRWAPPAAEAPKVRVHAEVARALEGPAAEALVAVTAALGRKPEILEARDWPLDRIEIL